MARKLIKRPQLANVKLTIGDMTYQFDAGLRCYENAGLGSLEFIVQPTGLVTADYIGKKAKDTREACEEILLRFLARKGKIPSYRLTERPLRFDLNDLKKAMKAAWPMSGRAGILKRKNGRK